MNLLYPKKKTWFLNSSELKTVMMITLRKRNPKRKNFAFESFTEKERR